MDNKFGKAAIVSQRISLRNEAMLESIVSSVFLTRKPIVIHFETEEARRAAERLTQIAERLSAKSEQE